MKRSLLVMIVLSALVISSFAAVKVIQVNVTDTTGVPVPVTMTMFQVRNLIGVTFPANWESLRVYQNGKEIPYQIDDVDMNGHISGPDILAFSATAPVTIKVSDDISIGAPHYPNLFKVSKNEMGGYVVSTTDDVLKAVVSDHGLVNITKFGKVNGDIVDQIGIARINGFPHSTYWANGKLGGNAEQTSDAFKVVYMKILENSPVRLTVLTKLEAMPFVGLYQNLITSIYPNGDVLVDTTFDFESYADLMKLQVMITHPLSNLDNASDAVHMLPVFRRLVWADQQGISPLDYWLQRNAVIYVNNHPYIIFPFSDNMNPPYWGATYIFASEENWRSNFSQNLGLGVAEILPHTAPLYDDYSKWMKGNTWVYESQEFRDGQFEWTPGEFYNNPITKNILVPSNTPKQWGKLAIHYIPGNQVKFVRLYSVYNANNITKAIQYLVQRTKEFRSIKISK
ncbi:hypothetical protein [Mesoaciditoga lauensis]|uniref:hypothetical protein n=1 Tax=Mesoaciditoga lauensis TaxID=1495039 RepID=UPI000560F3AF|nr:hypothetical protein [Mesoaciditoga lauensis]